jgi:hypothetical protein
VTVNTFLKEVVFTSPQDGWLTAEAAAGAGNPVTLWHYNGTRWSNCTRDAASCDATPGQLPLSAVDGDLHLATVGSRTYLAATRADASNNGAVVARYPAIFYHDRSGPAGWKAELDPASDPTQKVAANQGCISSITVARSGGRFSGWATGNFGPGAGCQNGNLTSVSAQAQTTTLMSLNQAGATDNTWKPWTTDDVTVDYPAGAVQTTFTEQRRVFGFPGPGGKTISLLYDPLWSGTPHHPLLAYGLGGSERWQVAPTPFSTLYVSGGHDRHLVANLRAADSDGHGGLWIAAHQGVSFGSPGTQQSVHFYHLTDRVPRAVFSDVAHPVRQEVTSAAGGPGGSVWLTTASSTLYRYDRLTGWDSVVIGGWDPGLTTKASSANAVAVGPDGRGVVVGDGGRVADVAPGVAILDAAAGVAGSACQPAPGPCGTSGGRRGARFAR